MLIFIPSVHLFLFVLRLRKNNFLRTNLRSPRTVLMAWVWYFVINSAIIMSRYCFLMRVQWGLRTFRLLCIFINYLLVEWWFRGCFFLLFLVIRYLWLFSLIWPSNQKTLYLVIVLFISKNFSHNLILVAIRNFIFPMLTSTDSRIGSFPRLPTIHKGTSTILFVWWLRLNCRLIIFNVSSSSRHLINDTEPFLC